LSLFYTTLQTTTKKGKQTNAHTRNSKINEEKQNRKHKWKLPKCNHVQEKAKKPAKQIPSGI
jgi:hypothetical protein